MYDRESITADALRDAEHVTIIDIRKNPDGRQIPGSVRYDGKALGSTDTPPFAKGQRVVVYCGSGSSCSLVAEQLREKGFDAVALDGGYAAWQKADLPTEPIGEVKAL
jgi:rhodanese-related sulfurtransferase